jgi:uncharacterized SAM-binding protein YcdF (DUF218 family)
MIYLLSKLFWAVVQPVNLIVILVVASQGLAALHYRRAATIALKTGLGILVTVTILPIGQMLLIPLEDRFPRPELPKDVAGIIILGGVIDEETTIARDSLTMNNASERLFEAAALARHYPGAKVLFTGGSADVLGPKLREAEYARRFFDAEGIAPARVLYETNSRNTYENATDSLALIRPKPEETWLLVTSAAHMPRSVGIFRKVGWTVVPDPVDYRTTGSLRVRGFRLGERLDELEVGLREWIGLFAYYGLGRTSALFPGPA